MVHITAFAMIFVNIPVYANQGETYDPSMHLDKPNKGMVSFTFRFLKVGCVSTMVIIGILPQAEFGRNDYQEDALLFICRSTHLMISI